MLNLFTLIGFFIFLYSLLVWGNLAPRLWDYRVRQLANKPHKSLDSLLIDSFYAANKQLKQFLEFIKSSFSHLIHQRKMRKTQEAMHRRLNVLFENLINDVSQNWNTLNLNVKQTTQPIVKGSSLGIPVSTKPSSNELEAIENWLIGTIAKYDSSFGVDSVRVGKVDNLGWTIAISIKESSIVEHNRLLRNQPIQQVEEDF